MLTTRERAPAPTFLPADFVDPAPRIFARLDGYTVGFPNLTSGGRSCRGAAPLPGLREALARRAEAFGPWDGDEPEPATRGLLARCGAALRGIGDLLDPPRPVLL